MAAIRGGNNTIWGQKKCNCVCGCGKAGINRVYTLCWDCYREVNNKNNTAHGPEMKNPVVANNIEETISPENGWLLESQSISHNGRTGGTEVVRKFRHLDGRSVTSVLSDVSSESIREFNEIWNNVNYRVPPPSYEHTISFEQSEHIPRGTVIAFSNDKMLKVAASEPIIDEPIQEIEPVKKKRKLDLED